jgi:hypothetical protein
MDWRLDSKSPATLPMRRMLLAHIEKQGRQYLDEVDNGNGSIRPASGRRRDAGADKDPSVTIRGWKPCAIC